MAFLYSTGFRNKILDSESVKAAFENTAGNGTYINLYDAQPPASPDAAEAGNIIVQYTGNNNAGEGLLLDSAASDGTIAKDPNQPWQGDGQNGGGEAKYFRVVYDGDSGSASTTEPRIQGTVGKSGSDLFIANTTIADGTTYELDFFSLSFVN